MATQSQQLLLPFNKQFTTETLHPSNVNKPLDFFKRKLSEYRQQEHRFVKAASVNTILLGWGGMKIFLPPKGGMTEKV